MPWGISHKYKFMFIHIPKTAGTTICSNWEGSLLKDICKKNGVLGGTHKSAMQLRTRFPKEFETYLKWTVVRNPYDRFVSKFFFKQLHPRQDFELEWSDKEREGLLPQLYWITDESTHFKPTSDYDRIDLHFGEIIVNRVLRYENLNDELGELFRELGIEGNTKALPHFRQTRAPGTYHDYFDEKMKSLVTYLYREDLDRLNYSWQVDRED